MGIIEIVLIGIGLSMDASAVSMSNGLAHRRMKLGGALKISAFFGAFQGFMPIFGYLAGSVFSSFIRRIAPWLSLILLGFVGGKMIYESTTCCQSKPPVLSTKQLFIQAVATSIDALAVGVSCAALGVNILVASILIAVITFIMSFISVHIGKKCGDFFASKAEILGGLILIGIGIKLFIEGLFFC